MLPLIRDDFNLDYTRAGWVVSAFTLAYGISQLPAGWLADRIGARLLIAIGISGVALCGILAGISPNYFVMAIFLVAMGILGGGYHPAASPLVSESVEAKNRGRALGLHQIGGTASFFLTPLIAVGIATLFGSWRGSFITLSLFTFVFGIILYVLLGRRRDGRQSINESPANHPETPTAASRISRLIPFIILGIVTQIVTFSTLSFIPLFAVDQFNTSEEVGGALLAIAQFAGLWAGPFGGYLSDRIGKVPVMLFVSLLAGPAVFLLSLVSLNWSVYLVLLILGMSQYAAMPITESYIITHSPERNRSTILGIYYFASRGGPGLLMPAMGWLSDHYSFATSFSLVGAAMLVIVIICSLLLWTNRD